MNLKELKEIFRLIEKTDFSEVSIERENWTIKVSRNQGGTVSAAHQIGVPVSVLAPQQASNSASEAERSAVAEESTTPRKSEEGHIVTSPFVGTFYTAPSPESEPYVQLNQDIKKGEVLCIVEAMKLMNELESEVSGKILEIYPGNGQAVEYGQKLFRIKLS